MKNQLLSIVILFSCFTLHAQVEVTPERPSNAEQVKVTYDATLGNAGLKDYEGDIYAHTGLITGKSSGPGDWRYVVANWNENKPQIKLKRLSQNKYELAFTISDLYGLPEEESITALAFVFRNEDGSKVGKATGDQDIFHYLVDDPGFEIKRPVVTTTSQA